MKRIIRMIALILTVAMFLGGCSLSEAGRQIENWLESQRYRDLYVYPYEDMVYERPDLAAIEAALDTASADAAADENVNQVIASINDFYDAYDGYYTNYYLANIRYCADMTDSYWSEENNFCMENCPTVDAWLDELLYALADSPLREELEADKYFGADFFDAYDGESLWNETFSALMEQEAQLQNEYYAISGEALEAESYSDAYFTEYGTEMTRILVELVKTRQQIAVAAGYDNYINFAYDYYYYRDFTPEETGAYLLRIRDELVPLYRDVMTSDFFDQGVDACTEDQAMAFLRKTARRIGGNVAEAFYILEEGGLYDIAYGENKYDSSFEVYLTSYYQPFIFTNPAGTDYDKMALVHEFGHFANDYLCGGAYTGTDVSEVMSQGMEYLSLCYGDASEQLVALKMADSLCTYVEQAAYASFEHQLYAMDPEGLTVDSISLLYEQIGMEYGFDSWEWDSRDFVLITHFFTHPMYIISYVVSNDAALQLYQLEQKKTGAGREKYQQMVEWSDTYFLEFVGNAGLESPFAEGRLEAVAATIGSILEY